MSARKKGGPLGRLELLDSIVRDTLQRIAIREYTTELSAEGNLKRRLIRIDSQSANAVANLVRVAMDLEGQRAGEEMEKVMGELEQLRTIVGGMLEARP
jgi:hypothetical protein